MAGRKSTRRANAPKKLLVDSLAPEPDTDLESDDARLASAIEAQRTRMFQVSAIAACLGHALEDVRVPGTLAPELQNVTDAMIQLLDDVAAGLDPTVLRLRTRSMLAESRDR